MRQIPVVAWAAAALLVSLAVSISATSSARAADKGCLPGVLKQRLSQIRQKFGALRVISTHRRGARIAGSGRRSLHASCRAVDFTPPRGKYAQVAAWLKRTHAGGVGTYSCGMHHIHIDNGPRVRFHKCIGRSGGIKRYAKRRRSIKRTTRVGQRVRSATRTRRADARSRIPTSPRAISAAKVATKSNRSFNAAGHFSRSKINGG